MSTRSVAAPEQRTHHNKTHEQHALLTIAALEFMLRHYADPWFSIGEMADRLHTGRCHLGRVFREIVGCSAREHLRELRVGHACGLLAATDITVTEIRHRVGLYNATEFRDVFRSMTGLNPSDYRTKYGNPHPRKVHPREH